MSRSLARSPVVALAASRMLAAHHVLAARHVLVTPSLLTAR
jgi:hypothetical protein